MCWVVYIFHPFFLPFFGGEVLTFFFSLVDCSKNSTKLLPQCKYSEEKTYCMIIVSLEGVWHVTVTLGEGTACYQQPCT